MPWFLLAFAVLNTKMKKKFRILISVFNKDKLIKFVRQLKEIFVLEIISTGGTAKHLTKAGFKVKTVAQTTKFPEILSGRVKTLHPAVFGGILADKKNSDHLKQLKKYSLRPFNMVVVNLYPFEKTIKSKGVVLKQAIEQIDIGGVALLRAAAKNFQSVIVVCDPDDYFQVIKILKQKTDLSLKQRKKYATKVFQLTSRYDKLIAKYFSSKHN